MITWKIEFDSSAIKSLEHFDRTVQTRIKNYLKRLMMQDNPRLQGKALTGKYSGLWRYRVGDYRLICNIEDNTVTILVLALGHRKDVYK